MKLTVARALTKRSANSTCGYRPGRSAMEKMLVVMKLTAFILLIGALHVSAAGLGQHVTIKGNNLSLEKVLKEIGRQTGYEFFMTGDQVRKFKKVNLQLENAELKTVLDAAFNNQPLSYEIENKAITIITKAVNVTPHLELEIPPITVRGRIVNENGEPVIASVTIKGTTRGTTSNTNGEFELNNVHDDAALVITATNIKTSNINIDGRKSILITVVNITTSLNEVVINKGYYSESKRISTGNVAKVDAKVIERQPIANPLQAIQGRMAGVYVQQTSGVPGGAFNIEIRGQNSLRSSLNNNGNLPLYIIDGVPFTSSTLASMYTSRITQGGNPLSAINPSDIQSIEVLKDADATAIYGSRGANGVVLITTKKGKAGTTKLDINYYTGAGKVTNKMDLLNTRQYVEMRTEGIKNDGYLPYLVPSNAAFFPDLLIWDTTKNTDWQKELIGGTAKQNNIQASVSGGNENTQFLLGGGYYTESTVFPGNLSDKKISSHFSLGHTAFNRKLKLDFTASYVSDNNNLISDDLTGKALQLSPNAPALFDEQGNLNWANSTWENPLAYSKRKYKAITDNLVTNLNVRYQLLENLYLKANVGYTMMTMNEIRTEPISSKDPAFSPKGLADFSKSNIKTWIIEPQAEWNRQLGNGNLSIILGNTFQQSIKENQSLLGKNYTSDALIEDVFAAPNVEVSAYNYSKYRYYGFFGRINYNLSEKYLVNLTGRRDGSSRFGPGRQFANFGAVGMGWIFSREKFLVNQSLISFGKIRASYGITGSDQIPDYEYLNAYQANAAYNGVGGLVPVRIANPDYSWEANKKFEAAIELGLFADKLMISSSYFRNRSSSQLVGYSLSVVTGQPSIQFNLPALVQNTGWEFEVSSVNIKNKSIRWSSTFNITVPKNKLIDYPGLEGSSDASTYSIGKSLSIRRTYEYIGVNPETGLYDFRDVNNDGFISYADDQLFLKDRSRRFFGGLGNNVSFNNWTIDFLFQFVKQSGFNYLSSGFFDVPGSMSNQPVEVMDRWQKPGDEAKFQQFTFGNNAGSVYNLWSSDNAIGDASFVRLKNVSVSYQLPYKFMAKAGLSAGRIYIQGQNLFTSTNYKGLDPETQGNSLPPLKMLTAGVQITL